MEAGQMTSIENAHSARKPVFPPTSNIFIVIIGMQVSRLIECCIP
jgi:hypothetical protein